jgi:RNA polymerase sigma-70 factor (ECF subfamily)
VAKLADAIAARRGQLLELVRRRGGVAVDAEDVLQRAIVSALEHADQLRDPARVDAWLGRVVHNALIDEQRRRPKRTVPIDEVVLPSPGEDAQRCACVLHQVVQMRPAHAQILRRVVLDGVPVTRVAAELGISANAAMVRLHRARAALLERLRLHCGTTSVRACNDCGCEQRGCCGEHDAAPR